MFKKKTKIEENYFFLGFKKDLKVKDLKEVIKGFEEMDYWLELDILEISVTESSSIFFENIEIVQNKKDQERLNELGILKTISITYKDDVNTELNEIINQLKASFEFYLLNDDEDLSEFKLVV